MHVPSVSLSSQTGQSQAQTTVTGHADPYCYDNASDETVDLRQASQQELATLFEQETLLALLQNILEKLIEKPLRVADPHHAIGSLYDSDAAPVWLLAARRILAHPTSTFLRLSVMGQLTMQNGESQPFVLDMLLPQAPWVLTTGKKSGYFVLARDANNGQSVRLDYSLELLPTLSAPDRCNPPEPARPMPVTAALPGTPLFAQLSLGRDADILCMAARLLPAEHRYVLPMRVERDNGYVDKGGQSGSQNQLNISA